MNKQVELIKAEIERYKKLIGDPLLSDNDLIIGERNACNYIIKLINSLPEEHVSEDLDNAARDYADACELDNDTHFMERQLCIEHFKAGARYDRNKLVEVVQQYSDKGHNMSDESVGDENGVYWDGFSDCADGILRELKDE